MTPSPLSFNNNTPPLPHSLEALKNQRRNFFLLLLFFFFTPRTPDPLAQVFIILSELEECENRIKSSLVSFRGVSVCRLARDAMYVGNGFLYPVVGLASCVAFVYLSFGDLGRFRFPAEPGMSFVGRNGTQFVVDGRPFYVNGWNSYWLMDQAVEEFSRPRVGAMFQAAAGMGLTVCRTWAFNDGTYNALQVSLGQFDERVFQALDRVIVEARRHGIRLLLGLSDDLPSYGGKRQYVKWAWEEGIGMSSSNDSFFVDPSIRSYFKTYLKTILTRKNHISGIEYRDDPTIFAWELMNEPRCTSDPSGNTLQNWIEEMAEHVKSIDRNHLVTIGLEGFYGSTSPPKKLSVNPGEWFGTLGTDFLRNSKIPNIDFTSVHIYPDQWLLEAELDEKVQYINKWITSHIEDGERELGKPVVFTEFGLSNKNKNFEHSQRDAFYKSIYDLIYRSARRNGAGAGAFIWQLFVGGMEEYNDDFGFVPGERPSLYRLLKKQSCRLARIRRGKEWAEQGKKMTC
ncbi:mannan endo-1,4-beta-mannosidase 2-like [Iris pallida]|uniref:mannan endo-1,4-beta-mannosidase n=1 Tax=Iris pallida TaxID=29817 RepID=A0AAX6GNI3_IRIPA|nr:mannan endo-1,4-beta-mannosidase 2-like [Iris pallida]